MLNTITRPAIIDIGSNSVRLVIYENINHATNIFYNEKFSCKLGKVNHDNTLSAKSKNKTKKAIERFIQICSANNVTSIKAFATAAFRDSVDGEKFAAELTTIFNLSISILSGEEEAYFASLGVIYKIPHAKGIVGDLGGGSLEIGKINTQQIHQPTISLPLGVLRIENNLTKQFQITECKKYIDETLEQTNIAIEPNQNFYCVGGSWRALMWAYITVMQEPLHLLQGFSIKSEKITEFLEKILTQKIIIQQADLAPYVSKKRFSMLPIAATLLLKLIKKYKFKHIIVSVSGVREGVLIDSLHKTLPHFQSSSLEFVKNNTHIIARNALLFPHFINLINQILPELTGKQQLYLEIIVYLSDIAYHRNSDYRAHYAFDFILYADLDDLTHCERILIASVVAWRYDPSYTIPPKLNFLQKKFKSNMKTMYSIALALRYLYSATGLCHKLAQALSFSQQDDCITIKSDIFLPEGEATEKRLAALKKHIFT